MRHACGQASFVVISNHVFIVLESCMVAVVVAVVGNDSVVGAVAVAIVGGVGVFLVYESSC